VRTADDLDDAIADYSLADTTMTLLLVPELRAAVMEFCRTIRFGAPARA
jgi:hypothetical protein